MLASFTGVWRYRHFIATSIRHDFVSRFARSRLGGMWMVLHPLAMVLIYALVLSAVLSAKLPGIDSRYAYAIYLTAGMLCWSLFMELTQRCLGLFVENGNLMKKLAFPRLALPAIATGVSLINYLLLFVIILVVFLLLGHFTPGTLIWLPLLTFITLAFSLGLGMVLGVLNVFMRDIGQAMPIVFQFLFWLTPVVYPVTIVPEAFRDWLVLNPLYHLVNSYHAVLAYGQPPALGQLGMVAFISIVFLVIGFVLYRKSSSEMVDAL